LREENRVRKKIKNTVKRKINLKRKNICQSKGGSKETVREDFRINFNV
jgi:DNA-binding transcriptional regulator WhiA